MTKPRILFMGTPAFALPALEQLYTHGYPIIGVITQPDRPKGRGQREVAPPVKLRAQKLALPVFQPDNINDPSFLDIFYKLNPDIVVVTAFGQILPKSIIDFPPLKCLNIHPSLLPKYRGAAPINWAIIRGETETGVTIMLMDEGMDSGDIVLQQQIEINNMETYGELHDRLAISGAAMLMKAIDRVAAGDFSGQPQNGSLVTFAPRLKKETGRINWSFDAGAIVNLIRGLSPIPTAYTFLEGQAIKIFHAEAQLGKTPYTPGTIGPETARGLSIAAADGCVFLKEVQLAGKNKMAIHEFLRGHRLKPGMILGNNIK
jgi:methionyl-tRNA formyltransferase